MYLEDYGITLDLWYRKEGAKKIGDFSLQEYSVTSMLRALNEIPEKNFLPLYVTMGIRLNKKQKGHISYTGYHDYSRGSGPLPDECFEYLESIFIEALNRKRGLSGS